MSVFAHIVEKGSITAAADFLHLSKSVVSQHLKTLEEELGLALLKRTTRRQTLTTAGKIFYERCQELNYITDKAWQQARDALEVPQGVVKITAPNALMGTLIAPAVGAIIKQYPLVEPELISSDQRLDLIANDIDLAIRVGTSEVSSLKQKRIGQFRDVLCASSTSIAQEMNENSVYIANFWQGQAIKHKFVHKNTGKLFEFSTTARCQADSFHTCLALLNEGAGIGLIPDFFFEQVKPSLGEVFPDYQLPVNPVYALHPYSNRLPLSVAVCLESIESKLSTTI